VIFLDELPRNATGKLMRRRLVPADESGTAQSTAGKPD
jgi:fatty-acyl-CoA synthase